ncbi:MAG: helix-turn-helix domain-containing protein [Firmicutes bacterium]|nr:helix-turn-helix domain-containing protein [Bacillota bacterium]
MKIGERIKLLREKNKMTQEELANILKTTKQNIYKYENGIVTNIPSDKIEIMSKKFGCSPAYLMGWESKSETIDTDIFKYDNIFPITTKKIPILDDIDGSQPIFSAQEQGNFIEVGIDIKADFCFRFKGDSMVNVRIYDGDIVFVQKQSTVENGEIAAVIIGNELILKRLYYYKDKGLLILKSENSKYEDMIYMDNELSLIKILGKAIAFQSDVK